MRRTLKNNIIGAFKSMYKAHDNICDLIDKKSWVNARKLLSDCGRSAISVISAIEKSEGEGIAAAGYLKEYCEAIDDISDSLLKDCNGRKTQKTLDKKLIKAENSVKNNLISKLEIAFMPYKASMWDSLESIWKAADEDPDCIAYVIPIPYYDKSENGSLGEFHYEGNEYPEYVPVTHYDSYDAAEKRPDIIYIHNPYDNYNNVTSVDPKYYSSELRKYTSCLVYVPYFSALGALGKAQNRLPAYFYADYVITQSNRWRKYISEDVPSEKLLPLGSPKFDRVIQMCKNGSEPPSEWRSVINGKKVVFYNTSLKGMLQETEEFLKKMNYVFDCFKNSDNAVMLWRPHPLFEQTIRRMRPQFLEEFLRIKRRFFDEELGIYDDTPDIEKTIALCDAYAGDIYSSVVSLFEAVGKPVFILDRSITNAPSVYEKIPLSLKGVGNIDREGKRWLINNKNRLYRVDPYTLKHTFICDIPDAAPNSYCGTAKIGNRIYLCPRNTHEICVVEDGQAVEKITLKDSGCNSNLFAGIWDYEKYLVLLPLNYPALVRYDTESGDMVYITDNLDVFTAEINGKKVFGGVGAECQVKDGEWDKKNGILYFASPVDGRLLRFDIVSLSMRIIEFKSEGFRGFGNICSGFDPDMWLTPRYGKTLIRFNTESEEFTEYTDMPAGFANNMPDCSDDDRERLLFSSAKTSGSLILFAPGKGNMFILINRNTGEISEWVPPFELPWDWTEPRYKTMPAASVINYFPGLHDRSPEECIIASVRDGIYYNVNISTGEYSIIPPDLDENIMNEKAVGFKKYIPQATYAAYESFYNSLEDFLNGKVYGGQHNRQEQLDMFAGLNENSDGTCGEKIHKRICEKMI